MGIMRPVLGWGGKGKIGEVWNLGTTFSQLAVKRMLVSGIFKGLYA